MKKLLRYLMGSKKKAPLPQERSVPAHVLALKAVARRRDKQANDGGVAEAPVTIAVPVVAERVASAGEGAVEQGGRETPSPRPEIAARAERKLRRVMTRPGLKPDFAEASEGAGGHVSGETQSPRPVTQGRLERKMRRVKRRRQMQTELP